MDPVTEARDGMARYTEGVLHDWYADDPHLQSLLRLHDRTDLTDALSSFGKTNPRVLDALVRENNRDEHLPRLRRFDGQGNRTEGVDFHPTYAEIGRIAYKAGIMARYAQPGDELGALALLYVFAQNGEAGHACPMACTAGLIKILRNDDEHKHAEWIARLVDPDYATLFRGAQFLTEVQGGSDVGSNSVQAVDAGDGTARLHGEKWFCSVIDADLFLVTARPVGELAGTRGVRAYVVPRRLPDGATNDFEVRRLKFKLGTRSMASAELDLRGAVAHPVGDFRDTVNIVLNTSRLYNAVCSAGMAQRAAREALHYARHRTAFGQPILDFPMVARIVARLRAEAYAIRGVTFQLAAMSDRMAAGTTSEPERAAWRMLVNLNKTWTSIQATTAIRDAIEILGGNGAIEEFSVLPRLLRDSIVCEAWEGSHNVLCAQALRDARRMRLHEPMFAVLRDWWGGSSDALDRAQARWDRIVDAPSAVADTHARDLAEELRPIAQIAALRAEARVEGSDPLLPTVIEHLQVCSDRSWDPLEDQGLAERVAALSG